jgi:NtrC-family two-component system sensor histidine kinase KinB
MRSATTILIVEDDPVERGAFASLLAGQGYDLAFATSAQALARAGELLPDVILLPASAGQLGLCRRLRAEPSLSQALVLLIAVTDGDEARLQALEAGADDWIARRADLPQRLRPLARLCSQLRESRQQLAREQTANAHLHLATQRHMAEVTTLNELSQAIASILDLRETLGIIADDAHWLLDVAAASVVLYDRDRDELWFGAASGEGAGTVRNRRLEAGQGIVYWVIQHGEPLLVPDVSQDPRFYGQWDRETGFTTRSILCVPLQARGRTIGAIEAINKASGPFDRDDLRLLSSLAASAAVAIENTRLYEQAQQEISERKRAEAELRRVNEALEEIVAERTRQLQAERDRTQAILEAVGEAVIVTDLQGRVRYLNPAALELTGYALEEAVGQRPSLWSQEALPAQSDFQEWTGLGAVRARRVEVVSKRKDGTLYDAEVTVAPLLDARAGDQPIGYVFVQRDVTPIKEAERLKDQFVSNVSHELRTPLSIIALVSGNLDVLYDRLPDQKRRQMVRDIRSHAQVLDNLVADLLQISQIESGRLSMEREVVDLVQLAREEVEKQSPLALKKAQTLRVIGAGPLSLFGSGDQLRQIVRNLLNNAIKYTPEGGAITCECTTLTGDAPGEGWPGSSDLPAGRWAALRVADTGIGIGQEDLPAVFERFFRVKTQGNIPGTGLGLAISKELVESHGGRIAAASALGQGSVFAIYLPLPEE